MSVTASQETYERLLDQLVAGDYPPGTRLVNRRIASEMGVSVIPVREALSRLASEGLVDHIPGAGSFSRKLTQKDIAQLYSFREQLEAFAVREASKFIQPYQRDRLREIIRQSRDLVQELMDCDDEASEAQLNRWLQLDAAFHETIIEAADNRWLAQAVGGVRLLAHVTRSKPHSLDIQQTQKTLEEHEQIAEAIESGNSDGAEALMRRHIVFSMNNLMSQLDV